jgi:hypothetical protein
MGAEGKYDLKMAAGYDTSNNSEPVASGTTALSAKSVANSGGKISFQQKFKTYMRHQLFLRTFCLVKSSHLL